jgi:HAD superfamily hydrolase (TIGR01509 family)
MTRDTIAFGSIRAVPELVIFDCDGVLVDSEPHAIVVNREMLAALGWHLTDTEIVDIFVGRSVDSNLATVAAHLGAPVPDGWAEEFQRRIHAGHEASLAAVDGIADALDALDDAGLPYCVASSGRVEKTAHSLGLVGLYDRFAGHIYSATQVRHGKPAPDLFLHAARAEHADPAGCVVVEDSRYGVQAARAAGMRAIGYAGGVTPAGRLAGPGTDLVTDMRRIPALVLG